MSNTTKGTMSVRQWLGDVTSLARAKQHDLRMLGLLLASVLTFLVPLAAGWAPAVFDDCAIETLPGLIATARTIQEGSLPLWDSCTFAGGKPAYVDNGFLSFYPPMLPFFLLVDTTDLTQCHRWLMLVPLTLHLLWAALGGYLFGRVSLGVPPVAALILGLLYSLSPEMGFQLVAPQAAITLSHLPWCMLAVAQFIEFGKFRWWGLGTILLALMGSTGKANYLIRAYFVVAITAGLLWLLVVLDARASSAQERGGKKPRGGLRIRRWFVLRLLGSIFMLGLSIGLTGIVWGGLIEAASWISDAFRLSAQRVATYMSESSMHPLNIVTLFIPSYFGTLDGRHTWGVGEHLSAQSTLSGGMFLMLAVFGAIVSWLIPSRPDEEGRRYRRWTRIGVLLMLGSLLTMMGRYTPVFGWLCAVAPWFFRFPHPTYYRFALCWSVAVLAALGVATFGKLAHESTSGRSWSRTVDLCIGTALGLAIVAFFWGNDGTWYGVSSFTALSTFDLWQWFLRGPVLYFVASSVLLVAALRFAPQRGVRYGLPLALASEIFFIAWSGFYATAQLSVQDRSSGPPNTVRFLDVEQSPGVQEVLSILDQLGSRREYRFVNAMPEFDNMAWYRDGRALLGYSAKPLVPWYNNMVNRFTFGKNRLVVWEFPARLFQNMNVRYIFALKDSGYLKTLDYFASPDNSPSHGYPIPGKLYHRTERFAVFELAQALPYVYTQDRIVPLETNRQLSVLGTQDLSEAVYVSPEVAQRLHSDAGERRLPMPTETDHFARLQSENQIHSIDQSRANRMTIKAAIARPSLLVITECWHPGWSALVDGRSATVHRVNYLQQGIWLTAGDHVIELCFLPRNFVWGCIASLGSLGLFIATAATATYRACRKTGARSLSDDEGESSVGTS